MYLKRLRTAAFIFGFCARPATGANVCFMMYSMADNDLESFLRADLEELMDSKGIKQSTLTTWVYIDLRNTSGGSSVPNIYNKDDNPLSGEKFTNSMYLTYDHDFGHMILAEQSSVELNSDAYQTVYDFISYAMADCKIRGSTEYFLEFSSHGAGFFGFGGDETISRRLTHQSRSLIQSNEDIADAIQEALSFNALTSLDVLAFDACIMSSYVAARHYTSVAKYLLASEANEPGHGWAYKELSNVSSAVSIAQDLYTGFLEYTNFFGFHETPKTLALTDLSLFSTFFQHMESLAAEMTNILDSSTDISFSAFLQRARSGSIAFSNYIDSPNTRNPSSVDIGSFLQQINKQCDPIQSSNLQILVDAARSSYDKMFILRGVGPGTKEGTGMHITFPPKDAYYTDWVTINSILFQDNSTFTIMAPKWSQFLQKFLTSKTPAVQDESVCSNNATAVGLEDSVRLLLNPTISKIGLRNYLVSSNLAVRTDLAQVDYGLFFLIPDTTDTSGQAAVDESFRERKNRKLCDIYHQGFDKIEILNQSSLRKFVSRHHALVLNATIEGRRLEGEQNSLLIYGGSLEGSYDESLFKATWDAKFIELRDIENGASSLAFVSGSANGDMTIPVMYFPEGVEVSWSYGEVSLDTATDEMGGQLAQLSFGLADLENHDPESVENTMESWWATITGENDSSDTEQRNTWLTLYSQDSNGLLLSIPRSEDAESTGSIVPILYVDVYQGELLAGTLDSIGVVSFPWTVNSPLQPIPVQAQDFMVKEEADFSLVQILAADYDLMDTNPERAMDRERFFFAEDDFGLTGNGGWDFFDNFKSSSSRRCLPRTEISLSFLLSIMCLALL